MLRKRDMATAQSESSWEVQQARRLEQDVEALRRFWDQRYQKTYQIALEDSAEIGRHGVIAELIQRSATSGTVLDAGCGTGILSELLDTSRFSYLGIDISQVSLAIAEHRRRSGIDFRLTAIEHFDSPSPYDAVVLNEVLYYLDVQAILGRIRSWLKPGGHLVVSCFEFPEGNAALDACGEYMQCQLRVTIQNSKSGFRWHIVSAKIPGLPKLTGRGSR